MKVSSHTVKNSKQWCQTSPTGAQPFLTPPHAVHMLLNFLRKFWATVASCIEIIHVLWLFDRHRIISKKKTGFISGIQRTKDGSIEWDRELPHTCNLSRCVFIRPSDDDDVVTTILALFYFHLYFSVCSFCLTVSSEGLLKYSWVNSPNFVNVQSSDTEQSIGF